MTGEGAPPINEVMSGERNPLAAAVVFASARQASRRIAGVAAAARFVRELRVAGYREVWLVSTDGLGPEPRALADVHRLAGEMTVRTGPAAPEGIAVLPGDRLMPAEALAAPEQGETAAIALDRPGAAAEILFRTGKPSDGIVSRRFNRPISRRLSELLLHIPGFRPGHATAATALLALVMFAALVAGGSTGLIVGGVLLQAASIFDGVDGEVARATFRSSRLGAALDTTTDVATSLLFIVGLTVNLGGDAVLLAGWGLSLFVLGLAMLGWYAVRTGEPFSFNRVKQHYRRSAAGPTAARFIAFGTLVTGRDFFSLLFAVLVIAGFPLVVLYLFAVSASIWILFIAGSVMTPRKSVAERA